MRRPYYARPLALGGVWPRGELSFDFKLVCSGNVHVEGPVCPGLPFVFFCSWLRLGRSRLVPQVGVLHSSESSRWGPHRSSLVQATARRGTGLSRVASRACWSGHGWWSRCAPSTCSTLGVFIVIATHAYLPCLCGPWGLGTVCFGACVGRLACAGRLQNTVLVRPFRFRKFV